MDLIDILIGGKGKKSGKGVKGMGSLSMPSPGGFSIGGIIAKVVLIAIIICVIIYLIGMLTKKKYRQVDAILLVIILILSLIGNPILSFVKHPAVFVIFAIVPSLIMLISNIILYKT